MAKEAEAEGEVARAEDGDHAHGNVATHDRRSAVEVIAAHSEVAALARGGSVEPSACGHPGQLTLETGEAETGLGVGELDEFGGGGDHGVDRCGDPALADRGTQGRQKGRRRMCTVQCACDLIRCRVRDRAGELARAGVEAGVFRGRGRSHFPWQGHATTPCCSIAAVSTRRPSSSRSVPITSGGRSRMTLPKVPQTSTSSPAA